MAVFEPIELLFHLTNDPSLKGVRQGSAEAHRDGDNIVMNDKFAVPLTIQARAYRNFYIKATTFAQLVEMQASGKYVSQRAVARAKDEFAQSRDICLEFNRIIQVSDFPVQEEK